MQTRFMYILFLILVIFGYGCKEEFLPETKDKGQRLVVDGMITNEPGPYSIRISRSGNLNDTLLIPCRGCEVTLFEKDGKSEKLNEMSAGYYRTTYNGIQGEIGQAYKIRIETPEGTVYESNYQELKPPEKIDTIYSEKEIKRTSGELSPDIPGYRFFIDTKPAAEDDTYFLWKLKETWEYTANYHVNAIFRYNEIKRVFWGDSLYRCWDSHNIKQIFTASTSNLSEARVKHHPLHFIGTDTKRLQVKYSLFVRQYTINREAFDFWNKIREQMSEQFYLFSSQPYQIKGNLYNPDNPSDFALGNFTVASIDTKRIFVSPPDFDFYYRRCQPDPNVRNLYGNVPYDETVYLTYLDPMTKTALGIVPRYCVDCTMDGGTMHKPDFW
jgi:hypothetical protein